jgi:hypothetical protein
VSAAKRAGSKLVIGSFVSACVQVGRCFMGPSWPDMRGVSFRKMMVMLMRNVVVVVGWMMVQYDVVWWCYKYELQ